MVSQNILELLSPPMVNGIYLKTSQNGISFQNISNVKLFKSPMIGL